jgi:hypothetical protein
MGDVGIVVVEKMAFQPGTLFEADGGPECKEFFCRFGHESNPAFTGLAFSRHCNFQRHERFSSVEAI